MTMDLTAPEAGSQTREARLADLGELAGPLIHEVNNYLNNLTLHLALLQQQAPGGPLSEDLQSLRRQASHVGAQLQRFQRHRHGAPPSPARVRVDEVVAEAAAELTAHPQEGHNGVPILVDLDGEPADGRIALKLALAPEVAPVQGQAADLRRLCRFLLRNAVRSGASTVTAAVSCHDGRVEVTVEDTGADLTATQATRIFDPGHECREGMCCLELAACRSIVRRLQGRIEARPRSGGGLLVVVSLPAAS
jgi:signal transduction histidine kinase